MPRFRLAAGCRYRAAALAAALMLASAAAAAGEATPAATDQPPDFWQQPTLTGDWGGERPALEDKGIVFAADSIDEVLGNLSGGAGRGTIYEGRFEVVANLDLDKLVDWSGATLHVNAYQIRGRGLSGNYLGGNLMVASSIEATRATRLFDFWIEQSFLDGTVTLRAGQIAADDEFMTSTYASTFVNATFGWPAILSTDLPSGGPAYPLATPGLRVKYAASDTISAAVGAFDGNPAGGGPGDPQARNPSGLSFRFNDPVFVIAEASYAVNQDPDAKGLAAAYKLGAWAHAGRFDDQHWDAGGLSLASPASNGVPRTHSTDEGIYLTVD
ncbi:MAG TPA: carbohydrate porin, partial [Stellaceae bacterium]|nr:carbohydrate porin [Stellaceae bacterium]